MCKDIAYEWAATKEKQRTPAEGSSIKSQLAHKVDAQSYAGGRMIDGPTSKGKPKRQNKLKNLLRLAPKSQSLAGSLHEFILIVSGEMRATNEAKIFCRISDTIEVMELTELNI